MTVSERHTDSLLSQKDAILDWIDQQERKEDLPLYSSVDIRDSGFKMSVVDTNLFPAGFNNLCQLTLDAAKEDLKEVIHARVPHCKRILLVTEEHTRNKWYLENVHVIKVLLEDSGFEISVASFLDSNPSECDEFGYIALETAKGNILNMHCLKHVMMKMDSNETSFDLIILNNDLTTGVPDSLRDSDIPIYPSLKAGWHSRQKSHHFNEANKIIQDFASQFNLDPWHFSCLHEVVSDIDINVDEDRQRLYEAAKDLFKNIQDQYTKHGVTEKPFIFLKADSGTYGMGVHPIESPEDILELNRKSRNKLSKGKSSQKIQQFLLQEGVPSIQSVDKQTSEACVYQMANHFVGGFYRLNNQKSNRENLNSQGMSFKTMCNGGRGECIRNQDDDCGVDIDPKLEAYIILARLAGIAAHREIKQLETQS
jgi:glutamate--cysteine ligase